MALFKNDHPVWDLPVAWVLLTRVPVPALPGAVFAQGARAVWAYPVVGLVLGALGAGVIQFLTVLGCGPWVAAGLALAVLVMVTGAMHEDGLADTADGLWGGFTRARRLEIMKDSRIGTYGVLALILATGLRWGAYGQVTPYALVCALVMSRAMMPVVMYALPHARSDGLSHAVGQPGLGPLAIGLGLGLVICAMLVGPLTLIAVAAAGGVTCLLALLARSKLGGQTGDILGATQIVAEIAVLVALSAA